MPTDDVDVPDDDTAPVAEVAVTVRPRVDFMQFAADLRAAADELEQLSDVDNNSADASEGGED